MFELMRDGNSCWNQRVALFSGRAEVAKAAELRMPAKRIRDNKGLEFTLNFNSYYPRFLYLLLPVTSISRTFEKVSVMSPAEATIVTS
jgi:hypothetical protein